MLFRFQFMFSCYSGEEYEPEIITDHCKCTLNDLEWYLYVTLLCQIVYFNASDMLYYVLICCAQF